MKRVSLSKYVELALRHAEYETGESSECVVAEVPDLPGCLTQGHIFKEARENLKEAIELWVAICLSKGRIPPPLDGCTIADARTVKVLHKKAYVKA